MTAGAVAEVAVAEAVAVAEEAGVAMTRSDRRCSEPKMALSVCAAINELR